MGSGSLRLTGSPKVSVTGTNASDFMVTVQPNASVAAAASTTFQVTFDPNDTGPRTAILSVVNDDSDENLYDFVVSGTGTLNPQTIAFATPADRMTTSSVFSISATASSGLPVSIMLLSGPATFAGSTITLTGVVGTVVLRATQSGDATFAAAPLVDRSFSVTAASGVVFTDWATIAGRTGPSAALTATPFNDGIANLLKYAFNMNAAGPDVSVLSTGGSSGLPQISMDTSGAEPVLRIAFLRRKGSGLIYTPQHSTTFGYFVAMIGTPTVTAINAQWERVTVEEPAPPATAPHTFARVRVGLP